MAIKELITLEGVDQVKKALTDLSRAGEDSLKQFREATTSGTPALDELSKSVEKTGQSLSESTRPVQEFRDILHVLSPIIRTAGASVGELGAFSRVAGAGFVGLAAAAGGAVVIALARFQDSVKRTQGELSDLFQSDALGAQAFKALQATASELGTSVNNVAPGILALTTAWQRFVQTTREFKFVAPPGVDLPQGLTGNINDLNAAYANFLKTLRAGRLDETQAEAAATAFFKALQNGGKLTADLLKTLPTGTVNLLAQALGKGTVSAEQFIAQVALAPIPLDKLLESLTRFGPQAKAAFDANAIITYKDVLGEILNTLTTGFQGLAGTSFSDFVIAQLRGVQGGIQATIKEFALLKEGISAVIDFLSSAWNAIPQSIRDAFAGVPQALLDLWATVLADAQAAFEQIKQIWSVIPIDPAQWMSGIQQFFDQIVSLAQNAWNQISSIFSNPIQLQSSGSTGGPLFSGFASGGYVRGPGTQTSDSILAFLSNMEFVHPAKAVRYYGLEFMEAVRTLRFPKDGFSTGGLARILAAPSFATGGLAVAGTPVTFVIDNKPFQMTASADTVKALSRFAVHRQISSTGRKPSWVK